MDREALGMCSLDIKVEVGMEISTSPAKSGMQRAAQGFGSKFKNLEIAVILVKIAFFQAYSLLNL